jgi:hypothetical protein
MNTVAFDADGRCLFVLNDYLETTDAAFVVHTEETVNPNQVWYDAVTQTIKPRLPLPNGVQPNEVIGLPAGTTAYVGTEQMLVDDGVLELEVEYPQTVKVVLTHVRYLDAEVEVPCEAQG